MDSPFRFFPMIQFPKSQDHPVIQLFHVLLTGMVTAKLLTVLLTANDNFAVNSNITAVNSNRTAVNSNKNRW